MCVCVYNKLFSPYFYWIIFSLFLLLLVFKMSKGQMNNEGGRKIHMPQKSSFKNKYRITHISLQKQVAKEWMLQEKRNTVVSQFFHSLCLILSLPPLYAAVCSMIGCPTAGIMGTVVPNTHALAGLLDNTVPRRQILCRDAFLLWECSANTMQPALGHFWVLVEVQPITFVCNLLHDWHHVHQAELMINGILLFQWLRNVRCRKAMPS